MFKVLHATIGNPPLIVKTLFPEHAFFLSARPRRHEDTGQALSAAS
jgi:hypothetical protein